MTLNEHSARRSEKGDTKPCCHQLQHLADVALGRGWRHAAARGEVLLGRRGAALPGVVSQRQGPVGEARGSATRRGLGCRHVPSRQGNRGQALRELRHGAFWRRSLPHILERAGKSPSNLVGGPAGLGDTQGLLRARWQCLQATAPRLPHTAGGGAGRPACSNPSGLQGGGRNPQSGHLARYDRKEGETMARERLNVQGGVTRLVPGCRRLLLDMPDWPAGKSQGARTFRRGGFPSRGRPAIG